MGKTRDGAATPPGAAAQAGDTDAARKRMGHDGEALAARFLEAQGLRIVARNYRCPLGELDLVAADDAYLVFVEVKTRQTGTAVHPSLAVNRRKQDKVRQLGAYFMAQHPEWVLQPRFDVISVTIGDGRDAVEHIPNAF